MFIVPRGELFAVGFKKQLLKASVQKSTTSRLIFGCLLLLLDADVFLPFAV